MCYPESVTVSGYEAEESLDDHSLDVVDPPAPLLDGDEQNSNRDVKNRALDVEDGAVQSNILLFRLRTVDTRCSLKIVGMTFIFLFVGANSAFVEVPANEVAFQPQLGQVVEMKCKSDCQCALRWFVNKHDSAKETLYDGYILRSRAKSYCTVLKDEPGKCHLDLTKTAESDAAQTYICLEPGTLNETSADLIFIDDHIHCHTSSIEDVVNLTCTIEFRGNWAPTMEWKEHSSDGDKVLSVGVKTVTVPSHHVTSTLVMPIQEGIRNYTCTAKFDISGKPRSTTATNVPGWNEAWKSPEFIYEEKLTTHSGVEDTSMAMGIGISVGLYRYIGLGVGIFSIATVSGLAIYCSVIHKTMARKIAEDPGSENGKPGKLLKIKEEDGVAVTPPQHLLGQSQA